MRIALRIIPNFTPKYQHHGGVSFCGVLEVVFVGQISPAACRCTWDTLGSSLEDFQISVVRSERGIPVKVFTALIYFGMKPRKQALFIDLDETLIYAHDRSTGSTKLPGPAVAMGDYDVVVRPEAHEILRACRAGSREVFLFTTATFPFALAASRILGLGFDERTIFSIEMIARCRPGLSAMSVLIDNLPASSEATKLKIKVLGITPEQLWTIPSYEPPRFSSARLFLMGLPLRLVRFDQKGPSRKDGGTT